MSNKNTPGNISRTRKVMTTLLSFIWILLLLFAIVAANDPPWLMKFARFGQLDESKNMKSYGDNFLRQGNYQQAMAQYYKALEIRPDYPGAMANLAMVFHRSGESDRALKLLERALTIKSARPEPIYYNMAEIYSDLGQNSAAIDHYLKTVDSEIEQDLLFHKLGAIYLKTGRIDSAKAALEKVLQIQTDPRTPYIAMLRKSMALYEDDPEQLAVLRSMLKDNLKESDLSNYDLDFIRQYSSGNRELKQTYNSLGKLYLTLGDTTRASEYLELSKTTQ